MKQLFVEWNDQYSVGVQTIDEQHKGLFALTNELNDARQEHCTATSECFKEILQKAISYIALHFTTEEKIMQKIDDPDYESHKVAHDLFVKKVMEEEANFNRGVPNTPEIFMRFLRDWIADHIICTDIKIGQRIAALKKNGTLKANAEF
ncbi:MAG: bacteriohemerythrin [Treponema sp.]|nr:bacteriohemerythrin [Treponema sp.]